MAEFYRVTRVRPNGTEQVLRDISIADLSQEQTVRAQAFVDSRERRATGIHVRVYSSSDGEVIPDRDRIWDSEVNE